MIDLEVKIQTLEKRVAELEDSIIDTLSAKEVAPMVGYKYKYFLANVAHELPRFQRRGTMMFQRKHVKAYLNKFTIPPSSSEEKDNQRRMKVPASQK